MSMSPEIEGLVEQILPQARSEAWKIFQTAPHALELDELISLAYTGLMMAATRWSEYCAKNGFSPGCGSWPCEDKETCGTRYFGAYAARRMRGAMLDAMRSSDWVTRSMRAKAKVLRAAGQDLGLSEDELSAKTGMTKEQVRDTVAGMARKPVSMDAEPVEIAEQQNVESDVVVSGILAAVVSACRALSVETQVVLVLHYFDGKDLKEIADVLGMNESRVSTLHAEGVLAVHEVMVKSVAGGR